ncbi:MAG: oligopeptidase B [Acidimicrobiia bacterium]|nr:MAG: oligopeptidase B [Acidimicrobiia bacterium]
MGGQLTPPVAVRRDTTRVLHGESVIDPYVWLQDKIDPDVIAHLEAENEYTRRILAPTEQLQGAIFDEIKGRTLETDLAVPARRGDWWYSTRTEEGKSYAIWVRMHGGPDGKEQLVLDENVEAEGESYFKLGNFALSADHAFVAYSVDTIGAETYTTRIRNIDAGVDLEDVLTECRYGLVWAHDGRYLFYTVADKMMRPFQIWRHEISTSQGEDVLVLQEDDERFHLDIARTRSGEYIVIEAQSSITESAWVIPTRSPLDEPRDVMPRVEGVEYTIDHRDDVFWVVTNDTGGDGRLVTVPVGGGAPIEVVRHESGRRLNAPMCFAEHVLVWGRADGRPALFQISDGELVPVTFDEAVYEVAPEANYEFEATSVRYSYESFVTPRSIFDVDLDTDERTLLKTTPVLGGYDPSAYVQERVWATSRDGVSIPVSLVRKADVPVDGTAPLLLYAYGSYEVSMPVRFSIPRLSLLERGVVYAIAHVRGGGEMGKAWYTHGKFEKKKNTFTDVIDAAQSLTDLGYCDPGRIAIRGGSAGGLTVGAAVNLAPKRFTAVVGEVPFVDVVNTMLDSSLPLTVLEWEEWGNPALEEQYHWMRTYAPYENVGQLDYPPILATAGLNDPRVSYWEPAKWVQRLRDRSTSGNEVLLKTEMSAGHFARSGRYDLWRDEALVLAFILTRLGAG